MHNVIAHHQPIYAQPLSEQWPHSSQPQFYCSAQCPMSGYPFSWSALAALAMSCLIFLCFPSLLAGGAV